MKKRLVFAAVILLLVGCLVLSACAEGESPIESIVVTSMPVTSYYYGDVFDYNNAAITVYRENGSVSLVPLDPSMISDFDSQKLGEQILTVRYGGATAYVKVTVTEAPIESIAVADGDYKKTYVQGQSLVLDNMFLDVEYSNGYIGKIAVTEDMVDNFDTTYPGERQLIINYKNMTTTCSIDVEKKSIVKIEIEPPTRLEYVVGDKIDFTGARLHVAYNNNTNDWITVLDETGKYFDEDNFAVLIDGEETEVFAKATTMSYVTVKYMGYSTEFIAYVSSIKAKNIEIVEPVKQQPKDNLTGVDLSDAAVKITYNNGKDATFLLSDESNVDIDWQEFDLSRNGTYQIKITCAGLAASCDVIVIEPEERELIVDISDNVYYRDGADIDPTQWVYSVLLSNGRYKNFGNGNSVAAVTEDMLAQEYDYSTEEAGKRSFELRYYLNDGVTYLSKTVEIDVAEKCVSRVKSFTAPTRNVYKVGEGLELSDGSVTIEYNDGTEKTVVLTADMLEDAASYYTATAGKNIEVGFVYKDAKYPGEAVFEYEITVIKEVSSLNADTASVKRNYILGESFDSNNLSVFVKYTDGSSDTIKSFDGEEWTFVNTSFDTLGEWVVELYYGNITHNYYVNIPVVVTNDIVSAKFVDDFDGFGEVTEGLAIDIPAEAKIIVMRQNGDTETVIVTSGMLDFDKNDYTLGEREITVTYATGKSLVGKVNVVAKQVASATVSVAPDKTVYVVGETELTLDGIKLNVLYNNGVQLVISADKLVSNPEEAYFETTSDIPGNLKLKISSLDATLAEGQINKKQTIDIEICDEELNTLAQCSFGIDIFKAVIAKISFGIEGQSETLIEVFETESLVFPEGAYIKIDYQNGAASDKVMLGDLSSDEYTVSGLDSKSAGEQAVTISYLDRQCSFVANVLPKLFDRLVVSPLAITIKEGISIKNDAFDIKAHFLRNDGSEYQPEYYQTISFSNINCTFDPTAIEFGDKDSVTQEYELYYGDYSDKAITVEITVLRKKATEIHMQTLPETVYVELCGSDVSLEGGAVIVVYDNGISELIKLDSNRLKIDSSQFDASEITGGGDRTATVYVSFEDDTGNTVSTGYNVTVKDRHYLTADFGSDAANLKYSFEYGTGAEARPDFSIRGYRTFGGNETELANGLTFDTDKPTGFSLYYLDENDTRLDTWPTQQGLYSMIIEFAGDDSNNPYKNDTVKIEITPKAIAVMAEDASLTFGEVSAEGGFTFGWHPSKYINNGGLESYPDGDPLVGEDKATEIAGISFAITDSDGKVYSFVDIDGNISLNKIPAGQYILTPVLEESLSNNYSVKSLVPAVLTVAKKDVKIVAEDYTKTYGEQDIRFRYKVYGYDADQNALLLGGYYDGCDGTITLFTDMSGSIVDDIGAYTLQRQNKSCEDVGQYPIVRGADEYISNYNIVEFEAGTLTIVPKAIVLSASQTDGYRKYGEKYEGEYARTEYAFELKAGEALAYEESFNDIFAELIDYRAAYAAGKISIEVYAASDLQLSDKLIDFAPDETFDVGQYRTKISIIDGIADNYEVTIEEFMFTILPMEAVVHIETRSVVAYNSVVDISAAAEGSDYYVCSAEYTVVYGEGYNADKATAPSITLVKQGGNHVGKYEIKISDSTVADYKNYNFTSVGDFGSYVENNYGAELSGRVSDDDKYKAFVVITPNSMTFDFATSETYARKDKIVPETAFDFSAVVGTTFDEAQATDLLKEALEYSFSNKTLARSGLGYVTADEYSGKVKYNYFSNEYSRDFIVGNPDASARAMILGYVLFGTVKNDGVIYENDFDYEVLPAEIDVVVSNTDFAYTGSTYSGTGANEKGVVINIPTLKSDKDALGIKYDLQVKYYGKTDYVKGEYVKNAGDYKIAITDLGNYNYTRSAETVDAVCEFNIATIQLDVTLVKAEQETDATSDNYQKWLVKGTYTGRADNKVMDNVWVKKNGTDGIYFSTQSQAIVNETSLSAPPSNLRIEPYYVLDGVEYTPKDAGTYDFKWSVNAEYVNYSVRFVKKNASGVYEEYEYKYVIEPQKISVLNMSELSSKNYDGEGPEITDRTRILLDGAVGGDKLTGDDLTFSFVRDMSAVPEVLRGTLITADDMTSAGRFYISATCSKTDNYYFVLDVDYYYINRYDVQITLNNSGNGYYLNKQFDTLAPCTDLDELVVTTQLPVTDEVNILLDVKYFRQSTTDTWNTYSAANGNPIGYYAYDFKPYFSLPDGQTYGADELGIDDQKKLLSWNYCYTIRSDSTDKNGCDGVYKILPKDIYLTIPNSETDKFTINGVTDNYYIHYHTYDSLVMTTTAASDELNDVSNGYYVSDSAGKRISQSDLDALGFVRKNINAVVGTSSTITNAGQYYPVNLSDVIASNPNFNILNDNMLFVIKKLDVAISLGFLTNDKAERIYGSSDAVDKVFDFADKAAFATALGLDASSVDINDWISFVEGDYSNNKIVIPSGARYGLVDEDEGIHYFNGEEIIPANVYTAYLNTYLAQNFNVTFVGGTYTILPKEIVVQKAQRDYFDTSSLQIAYYIDGNVNKTLEDNFISEILSKFSEISTVSNTASTAGGFADKGYYMSALRTEVDAVLEGYGNYTVTVNEVELASAQSNYYYIALDINKIELKVTMEAVGGGEIAMKYGQRLTDSDYKFVFSGFPTLTEYYVDYDYNAENAKQRQVETAIKTSIVDADAFVTALQGYYATQGIETGELSDFVLSDADFDSLDNYVIVLDTFRYSIAKRIIKLSLRSRAVDNYNTKGYLSVLAGERSSLKYSETDSGRLNYFFDIKNPEEIIGYVDTMTTTKELLDLVWRGGSAPDNYGSLVQYEIKRNGSYVLTAGECKMKLTDGWYSSDNYILECEEYTVMYYPVVKTLGIVGTAGELPYSAISLSGAQKDFSDAVVESLSMFVQISYDGMSSDKADEYVDLHKGLNANYYSYINHTSSWTVQYVGDKPDEVNIGDELVLRIVFTESFFNGETSSTIESKNFIVRVYGTEDETVKTKVNSDFSYNIGSGDVISSFSEVKDKNASYYLTNRDDSDSIYIGNFDYVYSEFILNAKDSSVYTYETILYENSSHRVVLGFKGGITSCYYVKIIDVSNGAEVSSKEITEYEISEPDGTTSTRSILSDINVFDGRRHKLSAYLDKVGYLTDRTDTVVGSNSGVVENRNYRVVFVLDDKYSYEIDILGGTRKIIEIVNVSAEGKYTYSYEYIYDDYIDFSENGKAGFVIGECTAFIGKFTLKTIGIRMDNTGSVRDVRLWPATDDSILYIEESEEGLYAVEELVYAKTINSVNGYDGEITYYYNYYDAVSGLKITNITEASAGFYRVELTIDVMSKEVYGITFYVCIVESLSKNVVFTDSNGNSFEVMPDAPIEFDTADDPYHVASAYTERQSSIDYSKIVFDYSNDSSNGTLTFVLKSNAQKTKLEETDIGVALIFKEGTDGLYTVDLSVSNGSTLWTKSDAATVDLVGRQNILEARYDYASGNVTIKLTRDGTRLMFIKARKNFVTNPSVGESGIREAIGAPGNNGGFAGFYAYYGKIKLYEFLTSEKQQSALSLSYLEEGVKTGIGTPADESSISGHSVILTDSYGMALATTTKNTYLRFRGISNGASDADGFCIMFANNTPYFTAPNSKKKNSTETDSGELTSERGGILRVTPGGIRMFFYKYQVRWDTSGYASSVNLFDGAEHTIVISITDTVIECYGADCRAIKLVIDGVEISGTDANQYSYVPENNDCRPFTTIWGDGSTDAETSNSSADSKFLPDSRYVGIYLESSVIEIKELFVF